MKKGYIVSFILGAIIFSGVTVLATNAINANEVTYKNTTLDSALDTLYERSTYTEYAGSTTVTPGTTEQILSTNNKLLKSNITISAIPSSYKKLSTATNFAASDLLTGKKAYNSNGELITGTMIVPECSNNVTCGDSYYKYSSGNRVTERTVSQNVSAGKYIVSLAYAEGTAYNSSNSAIDYDFAPSCSSNNCNIEKIESRRYIQNSSSAICSSLKAYEVLRHSLYLVEVFESSDTIVTTDARSSSNNTVADIFSMELVKVES